MMYSIEKAENYITENISLINNKYRPLFHASAPVGWINDPNGLCWYNGFYHMFCQYHPYSTQWGPMHWGHWTSKDLLHWNWVGVALAPDQSYDSEGCFSGTALVENGKLIVFYTGVSRNEDNELVQQQCVAVSDDGYHFVKYSDNPVIRSEMLPKDSFVTDFRDPKIIRSTTGYKLIAANRTEAGGQLLLFKSDDLYHWTYSSTIIHELGYMIECPDFHVVDQHEFFISCIMKYPCTDNRFPTNNPTVFILGEFDSKDKQFNIDQIQPMDNGFDFYAPQGMDAPIGECIAVGWIPGFESLSPLHTLGHGWNGMMSLPRLLSCGNGMVKQRPYPSLDAFRNDKDERYVECKEATVITGEHDSSAEFMITLKADHVSDFRLSLFKHENERFIISYDNNKSCLVMDRSCGVYDMKTPERETNQVFMPISVADSINLHIIVDKCVVEVFVQDGEKVMSSLFCPAYDDYCYQMEVFGPCNVDFIRWNLMETKSYS